MDNNNKLEIEKIAKKLDKFKLDDIVMISELDENEVKNIIDELIRENKIMQNDENYFYTKSNCIDKFTTNLETDKIIVIENDEAYGDFLNLTEQSKEKVRRYVEILNIVMSAPPKTKFSKLIRIYDQNSNKKPIPYATIMSLKNRYSKYGLKGIMPYYTKHIYSAIPDEIYKTFKKYYLTKEKLSYEDAIYCAQIELQKQQKIEQPYLFNSKAFQLKLKQELTKQQIEHLRNTIPAPTNNKIINIDNEPINILFKDAVKSYFRYLKREKLISKLIQDKTSYENHLKEFFDNLEIIDITLPKITEFKQTQFEIGCKQQSIMCYIDLVKRVVNFTCPKTNKINKKMLIKNSYALDINILTDEQISKLLEISKRKSLWGYVIIKVSLSSGISVPEILGLTWNNIDFEKKIIFIKQYLYNEKIVKSRTASLIRFTYIDSEIYNILKNRFIEINPNDNDLIFKLPYIRFLQRYFEQNILKSISEALKIKNLKPSDLVHNFVNQCILQNVSLEYIRKAIGYSSLGEFAKTYKNLIEKENVKFFNPLEKIV